MILLSVWVKNAQGVYGLETTTAYADYDNQTHVENLLTTYPFLPGVTFRVNNYRTKAVRYKDGSEISRAIFAYAYNGQGGTSTATYRY